jgi:ZIP family zinc transporter
MNVGLAGQALFWGLVSGSALVLGACLGLYGNLKRETIAVIMAFGGGVLVSVIAFDLMDEAFGHSGLLLSTGGCLAGAFLFTAVATLADEYNRRRHRAGADEGASRGLGIAIGSFIDSIPESIVIGVSLIEGEGVALATVIAVFVSNVPESLASSAGMKAGGTAPRHILLLWCGIAVTSGLLSLAGFAVFSGLPPGWTAIMEAIGAGALLAMIADSMIPEAFAEAHNTAGFVAALGFVSGYALSHGLGFHGLLSHGLG